MVVATVAAMTLTLYPLWSKAREKAAESQCMANVRQLAKATGLYLQDYDHRFPFAWRGTRDSDWPWALAPYLKIAFDPQDRSHREERAPVFRCPTDDQWPARVSYATNALIAGGGSEPGQVFAPERLEAVVRPAEVVWIGDSNKIWNRKDGFYDTYRDWIRPEIDLGYAKTDDRAVRFYHRWLRQRDWTDLKATPLDCPDGLYLCKYPAFRHRRTGPQTGYATFLFIDGHARAYRWGQAGIVNFFPDPTEQQLSRFP